MRRPPELTARRLVRAIQRAGFVEVRRSGSHRVLRHPDGRWLVFAFHDSDRIGPKMLARVARRAGLTIEDLR
ncbi:MAG: type II toxin-antitoxin system HicA family toxin [Deltaproteobacteria bacterium]|nr:type II toxin-antitoxin system HicA family toxin [Deltaproteobacteria bacterium]